MLNVLKQFTKTLKVFLLTRRDTQNFFGMTYRRQTFILYFFSNNNPKKYLVAEKIKIYTFKKKKTTMFF